MDLLLAVRRVGKVAVVSCSGRLVMGKESAALLQVVEELLKQTRLVVLQMATVDFIDSGGLGLLIRLLRRIETAAGRIALCRLTPRVALALTTTNMQSIFEIYESEESAIEALHQPRASEGGLIEFVYANILCAGDSADVVSYVSEVLGRAGYAVLTASTVPDAVTLVRLLAQPKLIITTPEFRAASNAAFAKLLGTASVLDLTPDFSRANVDASAPALLAAVRNAIGAPAPAHPRAHPA